jgi:large subunit ribosomal protein L19
MATKDATKEFKLVDLPAKIPTFKAGDTVRVWQKITEIVKEKDKVKEKTRSQAFEGLVLGRKHGNEAGGTFTVRKVVDGIDVERIFPIYSPLIEKVEILKNAKVRRAKLYHIRKKAAKEIRREMKHIKLSKEERDARAVAELPKVEVEESVRVIEKKVENK